MPVGRVRRSILAALGLAALTFVGVQGFAFGVAKGMQRAEQVLQPHGLIVLREDGGCDRYLDGPVTMTFDRPHRAQFVTAIWPAGPGAK